MSYLSKVQRTLREARDVRRQRGNLAACAYLNRYLYSRSKMVLFESRHKELTLPPLAGLEVVAVSAANQAKYSETAEEAGAGSDVANFERGAIAYLLIAGNQGVAIGWRFDASPLFVPLGYDPRATIYLGGYHVRDEFRGRGLYPYLVQRMFADAAPAVCAIAETAPDNTASQRGLAKAGFHRRGLVHRTMVGGCLLRCRLQA
jgi:ribosomal protein S18 acetylase RimI-like enzyme